MQLSATASKATTTFCILGQVADSIGHPRCSKFEVPTGSFTGSNELPPRNVIYRLQSSLYPFQFWLVRFRNQWCKIVLLTFNSIEWIFCRMWGQEAGVKRGMTLSMGGWKTSFGPSTIILTAVLGGLFQLTTGLSTNILCDAEVQTSVCLQVR